MMEADRGACAAPRTYPTRRKRCVAARRDPASCWWQRIADEARHAAWSTVSWSCPRSHGGQHGSAGHGTWPRWRGCPRAATPAPGQAARADVRCRVQELGLAALVALSQASCTSGCPSIKELDSGRDDRRIHFRTAYPVPGHHAKGNKQSWDARGSTEAAGSCARCSVTWSIGLMRPRAAVGDHGGKALRKAIVECFGAWPHPALPGAQARNVIEHLPRNCMPGRRAMRVPGMAATPSCQEATAALASLNASIPAPPAARGLETP